MHDNLTVARQSAQHYEMQTVLSALPSDGRVTSFHALSKNALADEQF